MEFFIEPIPVWAMCYLVNGDSTGLTDEDKAIVDEWWNDNKVQTVSPVSEESGETYPYFSYFPAFGKASDVMDCHIMVM